MPRLINYDWNHELLKETPYKRFLDLAVTFYIEVSEDAAMRIRDGMVEMSVDQMYEAARRLRWHRDHGLVPRGSYRAHTAVGRDAVACRFSAVFCHVTQASCPVPAGLSSGSTAIGLEAFTNHRSHESTMPTHLLHI